MIDYVVTYNLGLFPRRGVEIVKASAGATWSELQEIFDPSYRHDNLKFYSLGSEIKFVEGE